MEGDKIPSIHEIDFSEFSERFTGSQEEARAAKKLILLLLTKRAAREIAERGEIS